MVVEPDEVDTRVAALEALREKFAATPRRRLKVTARDSDTDAYVAFVFAYGYARLGRADLAGALVEQGRAAIPMPDAVHRCLLGAFEARIAHALVDSPPATALPDAILAQHAQLDPISRYKVDRLREWSAILEPVLRVDAVAAYQGGGRDRRGPEFTALRALAGPERVAELTRLVELAATGKGDEDRLLGGVLDELPSLAEDDAMAILDRVIGLVPAMRPRDHAPMYTRALVVAGFFGKVGRFAGVLLPGIRERFVDVHADDVGWIVEQSVRVLQRDGRRAATREMLAVFDPRLADGKSSWVTRAAQASARVWLDGTGAALEPLHAELAGTADFARRLPEMRALVRGYGSLSLAQALQRIEELAEAYAHIADTLSTNSHYALSVIVFVEALVLAITGG